MPIPTAGDRVKVVERHTTTDTKIVTEGTVTAVDEVNNRLDFDGFGRTKLFDTQAVSVRVEIVRPPLPTTPGSIVRAPQDENSVFFLTTRGWIDQTNTMASPQGLERLNVEIVFDAGASA